MSTLASNNINIDIADTQMQRAQKRDSQHIEVSKLGITSILKTVTEAAVITTLNGEIIGYNKQLKELVPHISDAQNITDAFKLTSSSLNTPCLTQLSVIVGRRSGSFPIQLTTVQVNVEKTVSIPSFVSMLRTPDTHVPTALLYKLDEHILRFSMRLRQIQNAKKEHAKFARQATLDAIIDPLTGLKNRRFVQSFMDLQWHGQFRKGEDSVLILFDIDHFKQINDKYGHPTGDEAIKVFADCLLTQARPTDVVGRWGGEEFIVLLTNCSSEQARVFLERVMAKIRLLRVPYEQGHISMTASAGYCAFSQAKSVEHSFTQADTALYIAKSNGRDRYKKATI
jgi:diguanylate cyclase (GGDEF)-like protein